MKCFKKKTFIILKYFNHVTKVEYINHFTFQWCALFIYSYITSLNIVHK